MKETWLSTEEMSLLTGKSQRMVVNYARDGKINECQIVTRKAEKKGVGRHEFLLSSLPARLQVEYWSRRALYAGSRPDQAEEFGGVLRSVSGPKADGGDRMGRYEVPTLADIEDAERRWAKAPAKAKERAYKQLAAIELVERLLDDGSTVEDAETQAAEVLGCCRPTITGLRRKAVKWPPAKRVYRLLYRYEGRKKETIDDEVWAAIYTDYMRKEGPALSACYDRVKRAGYRMPTYKTVLRRINEIPEIERVLKREGIEAALRIYPAQARDKGVFRALEAVNADGHKFDVFVQWPDGEISRPVMVAWQDIYSGKVLSYRVTKTENTDTIRLAFGDMISTWGIPSAAYLDNGRGFASKWLSGGMETRFRFKVKEEEPHGVFRQFGVQVHWATPYHGQAKPIERAFRDMCEYIAKHPAFAGAYTGNTVLSKPENYGSNAIPFEQFMAVLDNEIAAHNAREGRRSEVCNGRSFDQAFEASYQAHDIPQASEHQKLFCLMAAELIKPSKTDGCVNMFKNRYWAEELCDYRGKEVTVRFDPDNLQDAVWVYTKEGSFICTADRIAATGFNDTQAAREHNRARRQFVKAAKQRIDAKEKMMAIASATPPKPVDELDAARIEPESIKTQKQRAAKELGIELPREGVRVDLAAVERREQSEFRARLKSNMARPERELTASEKIALAFPPQRDAETVQK